jgi:putative oxidoreductase
MALGLLVCRIVIGILMAGHGAQKLFGWFGGGGLEGTARMFDQIGLRPGHLQARAAAMAEFCGGLAIAAGLLTPLAVAAIIGVMTAAVITVHAANGPWNQDQGFEYNLVIVAVLFAIAVMGSGDWSLDNALGLAGMKGVGWGLAALFAGFLGGSLAVASGHAYAERESRRGTRRPHPA